eukprot:TRINITY_DN18566_c0_g1_i1.p1 TRINITY_DN18566_c0_g1~~TRINITY_DN18566_c0_g1_i1.p1  ORF type:complete len:207 (-),score=18.60 TRINITY_DN18566_c0_g1_i1:221-841(-)
MVETAIDTRNIASIKTQTTYEANWQGGTHDEYDRVHRRCTWLNRVVFWDGAISEKAIEDLYGLGFQAAMEITKALEAEAHDVTDPSDFIWNAIHGGSRGKGGHGTNYGVDVDSRIEKRCRWLNSNVFGEGAIDKTAISALCSIDFVRAMELCKELEGKGSERVSNPSGYIKAAVSREPWGSSWEDSTWKRDGKGKRAEGGKGSKKG